MQIVPYPPGIPVLIRGEEITQEHLNLLTRIATGEDRDTNNGFRLGSGCTVSGWQDLERKSIKVYR